MRGLLLAGGHGTRLRPLTFTGNKHMIPIANRPMLSYGLKHLVDAGITEIGIVLGPIFESIIEYVGDGSKFSCKVTYIHQNEPLGIAHAVAIAKDFLGDDPFVVYLGDNLLKQGVKPLIESFRSSQADCVICTTKVSNPSQYGVVELDGQGNLLRLVEKPKNSESNLALVGTYLFTKPIFDAIRSLSPSSRNELEITDAIQYLYDNGRHIDMIKVEDWWKDTGKPEDLLAANQLVLADLKREIQGMVHRESEAIGNVYIGNNSVVHPRVKIEGPVIIGENCSIGPDACIGPNVSVGDNVEISSCNVENSIIMENCSISCRGSVINSIVGRNSQIRNYDRNAYRFVIGDSSTIYI